MNVGGNLSGRHSRGQAGSLRLSCLLAAFLAGLTAQAGPGPQISTDSPIGFFTNVAARLLRSELNVDLARIQIYPTNQYTPAVHRLLQLAANLYDATTNRNASYPFLPSVFRPVFSTIPKGPHDANIFIVGYQEVTGLEPLSFLMRDLEDPNDRLLLKPLDMVYGIPLILGAKKGFPNFNELAVQTSVYVTRALEFRRPTFDSPITETNQMFVIGISNVAGIEAWNSYTNPFPRSLQLLAALDLTGVLTNEFGVMRSNRLSSGVVSNIPAGSWPGYLARGAFQIPLTNSTTFLPASTYQQAPPGFVPLTDRFEEGVGFPVPHWWWRLNIRLRFALVDVAYQRIVDYVNLDGSESTIDITAMLMQYGICDTPNGSFGSQWCTNRVLNSSSDFAPTYGILNQIHVGDGTVTPDDWNAFNIASGNGDKLSGIAGFRYNLYGITTPGYFGPYYRSNIFQAPFNPYQRIYQHTSWQANDPLVHYQVSDLRTKTNTIDFISQNPALQNLGRLNTHYEPWTSGLSGHSPSPTLFDPTVKDPLMGRSDSWDFPEGQPLDGSWLGRVHRGTPWQTIYLKSDSAETNRWKVWAGVTDDQEARKLHPTNDWRIAALLNSLINTNGPRSLLSVNETNLAAWRQAFDGIIVLSNSIPDDAWYVNPFLTAQFDSLLMDSNSPQAGTIAASVNLTRIGQPDWHFRGAGDLLSTRELSFASPWLNLTATQLRQGINDEACERIPAKLLTRVRPDPVGTVAQNGNDLEIRFTGFDDYPYVIETTPDLELWQPFSTNYPTNGVILVTEPLTASSPRFYRSVLLP